MACYNLRSGRLLFRRRYHNTDDFHPNIPPSPWGSSLLLLPLSEHFWWKEFLSHKLGVRSSTYPDSPKDRGFRRESVHPMGSLIELSVTEIKGKWMTALTRSWMASLV